MNIHDCLFVSHLIQNTLHLCCKNDDHTYYSQRRWGEYDQGEGYQYRKMEHEFDGKYEWYEEGII